MRRVRAHLAAARVLAESGADLNLTDPDGTSALILAIINGHFDTAALLLAKGADPNLADSTGMTPLYATVDMNTLGEVYGRPAQHQTSGDTSALDLMRLLLKAHAQSERAAEDRRAVPRPHSWRTGAWRRRHAADARREKRRCRRHASAAR